MTAKTPREYAYEALLAIRRDGGQSHLVLRDQMSCLDRQDRAFLTRLIEGTLEYRLQLDWVIGRFSRMPAEKMKPQIREILRMSVYQILYMDAVPDAAAVNEGVKLAVRKGFSGLRGFVNGVLRAVVRGKDSIVWPDAEKDPVRYISVCRSVPEETVQIWASRFGLEKTEALCRSFLEERPLCVHRFRDSSGEAPDYMPSGILPDAFFLNRTGAAPSSLPEFRDGSIYIQDLSSQIAVAAADIRPGDDVLDLCAAPGGKSLLASERAGRHGSVLSRDLTEEKTARIRENTVRCRRDNIRVETADARIFDPVLEERFDVVIADLPCSGFGVAGRKPEIKYKPYRETVAALAELQREILQNAVRYVRPGGKLLYSTCTIAEEENEDNARWLRETFPLQGVDLTETLPPSLTPVPSARQGFLQLLPCDGPWDGFFFAILQKCADHA